MRLYLHIDQSESFLAPGFHSPDIQKLATGLKIVLQFFTVGYEFLFESWWAK